MTDLIRTPYFSSPAAQDGAHSACRTPVEASSALSGMLLAAVLSALLVVADQVIDTWVDGHMLAAWVALWSVTFATLALLATPLRKLSSALARAMTHAAHAYQEHRMQKTMWGYAQGDIRIMAELQQAWLRSQG